MLSWPQLPASPTALHPDLLLLETTDFLLFDHWVVVDLLLRVFDGAANDVAAHVNAVGGAAVAVAMNIQRSAYYCSPGTIH